MTFIDDAALDEFLARHLIQGTDIAATVCEDERGSGWIVIAVPILDQRTGRLFAGPFRPHHSSSLVSGERVTDTTAREVDGGVAHPFLALAIDRPEFGISDAIGDGAESRACLDRLQLIRVADEDKFGASPGG